MAVAVFAVGVLVIVRPDGDGGPGPTSTENPPTVGPTPSDGEEPSTTTTTAEEPGAVGHVIYQVSQGRSSQVFVVDLASGDRQEVAGELTNPTDPTADAAGERVAVVADAEGGPGIFLRPSQDAPFVAQPLPVGAHSPALSPDGTQLAFVADAAGQDDVHLMDVATLRVTTVANSSSNEFDPAWGPSGEHLVFLRHGSTADVVVVARPDGSVEASVAPPGGKWSPALSPVAADGRILVSYVGERDGQRNPETVDPTTAEVLRTYATAGTDLALTRTAGLELVVAVLDGGLVVIDENGEPRRLAATEGADNPQWFGPVPATG